jgi:DNA-binding transcriptional LysR family regulator
MSLETIHGIEVLIRVADLKSFTKTAYELGVSTSAVSNAITRLESALGVRLLHRTTRSLSLTQEGVIFVERCRHALNEIQEAQTQLSMSLDLLSGALHLSAPAMMARTGLVELLHHFTQQHPDLTISLKMDDHLIDLARDGIDVVIRFGEIKDSRLVAKRIGTVRYAVYGAPDFFARHGRPQHPDQLPEFSCITSLHPETGRPQPWRFSHNQEVWSVNLSSRLETNNADALLVAAENGMGLIRLPSYLAARQLELGKLEEVLYPYSVYGAPISLVYRYQRFKPPKIQAFVDFISAAFAQDPIWNSQRS